MSNEYHVIANARLGIIDASGIWTAYLWGRNLTDEFYVSTTVQNSEMQSRYFIKPYLHKTVLLIMFR